MTTMTRSMEGLVRGRRRGWTTVVLVVVQVALFWALAAALVIVAHLELDPLSAAGGAAATIGAIVVAGYGYIRLSARNGGVSHALAVGSTWLALSIVAEMAITSRVGHGWFTLIGSPDRPLLRNVFLFVWIFAPALFARGEA
jgi:hypothetical protein